MPWADRFSLRCLVAIVAVFGGTPVGSGARAVQHDAAIRSVIAGQVASGDISGDLTARFSVLLVAGQFATIVVAHRGVDIVVRQPDADRLRQIVSSSDGPDGEIRLPVYTDVSAPLTFEVAAAYPKTARGTYAFRLMDVREATAVDRQVAEGQRLHSQAVYLRGTDAFTAARARAREALVVREKALGSIACDTARSLLLLGQIEDASANFSAAEADYLRARRIVEGLSGSNELLRAQILDSHGANLIAQGKYREAEPLVREALAIRERILGPAHALVAASTATLADFHHESANVQEAFSAAQRALEIAAGVYGPDDIPFGDFLNRIARSELAMGNYARAGELYAKSLETREKTPGAPGLAVADSLGGLARVALLANDNAAAEERHLRSLAIRERLLGPDHPQVANDVFNLGLISYRRRDFATAVERYQRALAIREKTFGRRHPVIAMTLNNLGLVYWRQSDYVRAEQFFSGALELSEQLYGADSLRVTNALANLGIMAKEQGHYALAETRYRRALAIKEKHLGPDHPDLITLVESLAILYRDSGEYSQAEQMFERTLLLTAASLGPEHPFVARHHANLSQLYWAMGDWDKALASRSRVIAIEERNLPLELATGSERQKLAYFEPLLEDLEETITLHVRGPRDTPAARDLALLTLLQRKGRIFDALADNIGSFRDRATAPDRELLDRLSDVTSELAKTALTESSRLPAAERQRTITRLAAQRERLEIEVQHRSAGYLSASRTLTLADVRSALPPNAALIEFARYRPFDPAAPVESEKRFGAPRYVAYVMRRNSEPGWKELGEADPIDEAVERFRAALADSRRATTSAGVPQRSTAC